MEEQYNIIDTVTRIFNNSDKHNWDLVLECFHFEVFLDYFSMSKIPGAKMKSSELVKGWSDFLPKFSLTHHMLTNYEVSLSEELASVFCKGSALHYLSGAEGGETWTTFGTYDFKLVKIANVWKVNSMTFTLLFEDGNKKLPALARM